MYSGLLFLYGILRALSAKGLGGRYRICIGVKVHIAKVQCAEWCITRYFGNDRVNSDVGGNIPSVTV